MVEVLTFEFASVTRVEGRIIVVLFDGPEREVILIARTSQVGARSLLAALGSVLNRSED